MTLDSSLFSFFNLEKHACVTGLIAFQPISFVHGNNLIDEVRGLSLPAIAIMNNQSSMI